VVYCDRTGLREWTVSDVKSRNWEISSRRGTVEGSISKIRGTEMDLFQRRSSQDGTILFIVKPADEKI
jgi:hypothetical protein